MCVLVHCSWSAPTRSIGVVMSSLCRRLAAVAHFTANRLQACTRPGPAPCLTWAHRNQKRKTQATAPGTPAPPGKKTKTKKAKEKKKAGMGRRRHAPGRARRQLHCDTVAPSTRAACRNYAMHARAPAAGGDRPLPPPWWMSEGPVGAHAPTCAHRGAPHGPLWCCGACVYCRHSTHRGGIFQGQAGRNIPWDIPRGRLPGIFRGIFQGTVCGVRAQDLLSSARSAGRASGRPCSSFRTGS